MEKPYPAYRGSESDVFVSYSHTDGEVVLEEIQWLQEQGISVWYDKTGIGPGNEWNDEVAGAIKGAAHFLFFITPNSVASEHCRRELNFAQSEHRAIIVVHLEETEVPDGLRLSLDHRQAILKYALRKDEYRHRLLGAVGASPAATTVDTVAQPQRNGKTLGVAVGLAAFVLLAVGGWLLIRDPPVTIETTQESNEPQVPPSVSSASALANINSIAVLPFEDASPSQDMKWLAVGLSAQLRNKLAQVKGLKILPRHTGMGSDQANVSALLNGVVQATGKKASVFVELVDPLSREAVWSQSFDGSSDDPIELQEQILFQILRVLENHIVSGGNTTMPRGRAAQNAWFKYLAKGRSGKKMWLEQTLKADPSFAEGHLAAYWMYINYARATNDGKWMIKARSALDYAAELGPGENPALQMAKGNDLWQFRGQFEQALPYLQRSLNEGGLAIQYGIMMLASGLVDETRTAMEQTVLLQPYESLNWWILAQARGLQGDTAGVLEASQQRAKLSPSARNTHLMNWARSRLGQREEVEHHLAMLQEKLPLPRHQNFRFAEVPVRVLEFNLAEAAGDQVKALQAIERLESAGRLRTAGILYLRMGDERATRVLAAASQPPFLRLNSLPQDMLYLPEQYREDPRIRRMLDAMGLTKQWRLTLCRHLSTLPAETYLSCDPSRYTLEEESAG